VSHVNFHALEDAARSQLLPESAISAPIAEGAIVEQEISPDIAASVPNKGSLEAGQGFDPGI
jgi:hypothetical protein